MKIVYINTQNITLVKDRLINDAIKAGMQYIEMENEVIIEGNYLFRFTQKEEYTIVYSGLREISYDSLSLDLFGEDVSCDNSFIYCESGVPKFTKKDYKQISRMNNHKVKTKINCNRRRYL